MESQIAKNVEAATEASIRDQIDRHSPLQQNVMSEKRSQNSDQNITEMITDSATYSLVTPKKKSLFEVEDLEFLGKSPKSSFSAKHKKQSQLKGMKNLSKRFFKSPSKSKEIKSCSMKRQLSRKSLDESDVKSLKAQGHNNEMGEVSGLGDYEDINESLEQKADKVKMNAKNVRSVIHHVLKNEQVLSMLREALELEQQDLPGQSSPMKAGVVPDKLDSLPKMTRAKVKEYLEKISMPSPVKSVKDGPSILDVEFNEEEDDDEYNPEKDEECHESDDESITSSMLSGFGSPYRDVLSTSVIPPSGDDIVIEPVNRVTTADIQTNSGVVSRSTEHCDNVQATLTSSIDITDEVGTIALRTRSKLPLTSTSITEIESAFVAPDITTDMYYNCCDDAVWVQFLSTLDKTTDDTVIDDDADANDPEFNYIAEAEREQLDEEDFRFDKPTQVSKKELTSLEEELNEWLDNEVLPYQAVASASEVTANRIMQSAGQDIPSSSTIVTYDKSSDSVQSYPSIPFTEFKTPHVPPSLPHIKSISHEPSKILQQVTQPCIPSYKSIPEASSIVTHEQRALIEDNMRKHIQLLLQSFMMCQKTPSLKEDTCGPNPMIVELNYLRQSSSAGETSVFNVCNLNPALEFVSESTQIEISKADKSNGFRWNPGAEPRYLFSPGQKIAISNSPAFVYPHLLPHMRKKGTERKYSKFYASEDNLIALGLEQFQECQNVTHLDLIQRLLLRGKNVDQIFFRVQYMSSSRVIDNPIKCVKKTGKLPANFPKPTLDNFYPMAPKDQSPDLLPVWCSNVASSRVKRSLSQSCAKSGLSVTASKKTTKRKLLVPTPSGQALPELSAMSIQIPQEQFAHMQQSITPQHQSPQNISQVSQLVTLHSSPAVQLPSNLPHIAGIYIQFAPPFSQPTANTATHNLPIITLPTFAPQAAGPCEVDLGNSTAEYQSRDTKRKASSPAGTSISKKIQRIAATDWNTFSVNNSGTQTEKCASSDLLAKTMLSCGIEESLSSSSPQSRFLYSNDLDISFSSSTPVDQDKHSSVRNLNWEFDAAHKQSVCDTQTTKLKGADKFTEVYTETLPILTSPSTSFFTRSESSEVLQTVPASMPLILLDDPVASVPLSKEAAYKKVEINPVVCKDPPAVSKPDTFSKVSKQDISLKSGCDGDHDPNSAAEHLLNATLLGDSSSHNQDLNSPSEVVFDAMLLEESEELKTKKEKQSSLTACQTRIQESGEYNYSTDFPSQNSQVTIEVTAQTHPYTSASEPMETIISDSYIDDKETPITTLNQQPVQSDVSGLPHLSDTSDDNSGTDSKADEVIQIYPLVTNISSSRGDKTLALSSTSSESSSDSTNFETIMKPKTVRQMLEASKRKKVNCKKQLLITNSSTLAHDVSSINVNIVDPSKKSDNQMIENTKTGQLEQVKTLLTENIEHLNEQQTENPQCGAMSPSHINAVTLITLHSPAKSLESTDNISFSSPFKTPTKLRPIVAKALSPASSSSSPYVPLPKMSPKRKELNRHVRQILPKSFVFEIKSPSPTKTAAQVLKRKATMFCQNRSPVKLLPKQPQLASSGASRSRSLLTPTRMLTRSQKTNVKNTGIKSHQDIASPTMKNKDILLEKVITAEPEMIESEDAILSQEEEEEEFEDEDQSQLDDLMAACTTIGYDPKKCSSGIDSDNKSKAQKKRDICLSMLEPDIIDRDPKKDERDTAYAQHYFTLVKQVLSNDPERFKKFLTILHDMNKNHMNPVELCADMTTLLSEHQDLVDDFAGFLLSYQAVECKCFVSYLEYQQILTFLRRLEIYCDTSNLTYQRTLKMMSRWLTLLNQEAQADTTSFKEKISAVLRHVPNIMDDLLSYFFGTPLPDSHPDDFEEVDLVEDAAGDVDEFEEITLPESREDYNTKLCSCQCHQDHQDEKLRRRIKHCFSCSLKIFDGKPVLKTSRNEYRPITVLYPLEEKEKMIKAKKEAAQLALAKARAQRQQNKKKGKKRNVGNLQCKSSKNMPVKKKFKRRKRYQAQSSSSEVGNIINSVNETENKKSDVWDGQDDLTHKQEEPDLKSISRKLNDDQNDIQAETSTGPTVITGSSLTSESTPQISPLLSESIVADGVIIANTDLLAETSSSSALTNTLEIKSCLPRNEVVVSTMKNTESYSNTEPIVSKTGPTINISVKSDSNKPRSEPNNSMVRTANIGTNLLSSDISTKTIQQLPSKTPQSSSYQSKKLSAPIVAVSSISPGMIVSLNSLSPAVTTPFPASTDMTNATRTVKSLPCTITTSQNPTFMPRNLRPRFPSSSMVTSTRIPVIVALSPQQYLPSASRPSQVETPAPGNKSIQSSLLTTSHEQISFVEPSDKCESYKQQQDFSLCVASSDHIHLSNNSSSTPNLKPSLQSSSVNTNSCFVAQVDDCLTTQIVDSSSAALIPLSSIINFTDLPSSFRTSNSSTVDDNISANRLDNSTDLQQSDTTFCFSTPVKRKFPEAVVRAHLDNFSLGAYEGSIGFHQLQQFAQSLSPNKLLADSMTKFDLLALLESSSTYPKESTLQSGLAGSTRGTTTEPLLSFSGALAKFATTSEEPTLTSLATVCPQNVSRYCKHEDLPIESSIREQHDQAICDYVTDDEKDMDYMKGNEEEILKEMCPQLSSTDVLLNDESSNAFEISVWTEEQDRAILNIVTMEGVSGASIRKLQSVITQKSSEEISSRARLLLRMLEDMGDTESDTGTEASQSDHDV